MTVPAMHASSNQKAEVSLGGRLVSFLAGTLVEGRSARGIDSDESTKHRRSWLTNSQYPCVCNAILEEFHKATLIVC